MAAVRSLVAVQLAAIGIVAVVQAVAGSPHVFEPGAGVVAAIAWFVLSIAAFFAAAIKAYDNRQYRWLGAVIFFWPLMYLFAFKYAQPSSY